MAASGASALAFNRQNIAALRKTVEQTANAIPNAVTRGGNVTAMAIKPKWVGIMQAHGISPSSKIARRKWRVYDSVKGKTKGTGTVLIAYGGPVHLVIGKTKGHIIAAKLLGTRSGLRTRAGRLGEVGTNRGVFGTKQVYVNYSRYGSVRQQAKMGVLRRREGKHALTIGGNLRAYARHKGTHGDYAIWEESKRVAIATGPQMYAREVNKALAENFGKMAAGAARSATGGVL